MAAEHEPQVDRITEARDAVARSLPYLRENGRKWMDGQFPMQNGLSCVSCHYVNFAVWSHREAARIGVDFEQSKIDRLAGDASDFIHNPDEGRIVSWSHLMLASEHAADWQPDRFREWAGRFGERQTAEGAWQARGQFPTQARPVEESNAVATMWALIALHQYREDPAMAPHIEKALQWLEATEPRSTTEWHAWRMLVAATYGTDESFEERRDALLARQNDDGGWSWLPENPSDAYTTGQVLYVLARAGVPVDERTGRAVDFLLRSQEANGTWTVPSEWISAEPSEDKNHIYSYWGTAWAAIGLARHTSRAWASNVSH